jgi:hypothetical protein
MLRANIELRIRDLYFPRCLRLSKFIYIIGMTLEIIFLKIQNPSNGDKFHGVLRNLLPRIA